MKKIILILIALLSSNIGQAKFLKAVLYLEDGTKKTGLAELVQSEDSKINFKINEEAKKEKILSAEVKKIEYIDTENNKYIVEKFYFTTANLFTGKFSKSKKKIWFYIVYDKDVKIGAIPAEGGRRPNAGGTSSVVTIANTAYYFGKSSSEDLVFGFATSGNNLAVGTDSLVRKMSKEAFSDCPKLIDAIEKEDFKSNTVIDQLKVIFEKNKCKK
ncbi:hypothetical protein HYN56_05165 [Flavobacterium crocinum]|uniref:DUF4468 domain-containing protein n=1 Tax=Flavobacterium crocinum TaxID=2183896 RepID=A0A2S1YHW1_9FLAO|nr:hypothetical protein [Flavobacterium crocinum]AWK03644.1 hypothetical protein HYN56_05165 [Flavobacterium crocinum]